MFSHIRYNTELLTLHRDGSMMPADKENCRLFNYTQNDNAHPHLICNMACVSSHPIAAQTYNGHALTDISQPYLMSDHLPGHPVKDEHIVATWSGSLHKQDLRHMINTRVMLPMVQGNGNVWLGGSWCNLMGHAGATDAGIACAVRLGANCPLKGKDTRDFFFSMACNDMFGPRFDWRTSVRKKKPIFRAAL